MFTEWIVHQSQTTIQKMRFFLGSSLNSGLRALTSTAALMQPDDCWPTPSESRQSQDTARKLSALRRGLMAPTELAIGSEKWLVHAQQRQLDAPAAPAIGTDVTANFRPFLPA